MVIVHVVEPFASGIATFVRSLVKELRDDTHIVVHGERGQVMGCEEVKMDFPRRNVRFIRWRSAQREVRLLQDLAALVELYWILRKLRKRKAIDAVHLHSSKSGFLGRLAAWIAGIKTVIYTPNGAPFLTGSRAACFAYRQLERLATHFGGRVVCCSLSECLAYRGIGIDAVYINNGVAVRRSRRRGAAPGRKFRVVTCGRVVEQKDPALFNHIARYFEAFADIEFIWIGSGPDRDLLTASNITVTGWLSIRETERMLSTASIYLSTSHFEGMPFAALEALVLRKPVLLKDCTGNRDIVPAGINGDLFVGSEEAILAILRYYANREMLPVMGEYSKLHCEEQFDVRVTSGAYRDLYRNDAGGRYPGKTKYAANRQ